jgi:hypothetical protein
MFGLAKITGAVGLICLAGPAAAAVDVDLALVLAVDVSRSMDQDEQRLQRNGYVAAFRHPDVIQAIKDGLAGRIAVTYMEWSGPSYQDVLVPWTIIGDASQAEAFAAALEKAPMMRGTGTSISGGLEAAARLFASSGASGGRQVIDVSGDGPNNMGEPVTAMRDMVVGEGIAINGLPIILKTGGIYSQFNISNLDSYYRDCVIGGPGAFMVTVDDTNGFEKAIRRKLVLEISGLPARLMSAAEIVPPPSQTDCLIGEKLREKWIDPMLR